MNSLFSETYIIFASKCYLKRLQLPYLYVNIPDKSGRRRHHIVIFDLWVSFLSYSNMRRKVITVFGAWQCIFWKRFPICVIVCTYSDCGVSLGRDPVGRQPILLNLCIATPTSFFPLQRSFSTPISALFYPSLSISFPNPFPPVPPRLFHRS